jgi:hypothetical protein
VWFWNNGIVEFVFVADDLTCRRGHDVRVNGDVRRRGL